MDPVGRMNAADASLKELSPSYFALVMATGIVSMAADAQGMRVLAVALFALNVPAYLVLWTLTVLRLTRHRRAFSLYSSTVAADWGRTVDRSMVGCGKATRGWVRRTTAGERSPRGFVAVLEPTRWSETNQELIMTLPSRPRVVAAGAGFARLQSAFMLRMRLTTEVDFHAGNGRQATAVGLKGIVGVLAD